MPALLLAGTRFLIAGSILLAWCRWRGLRLFWPRKTMAVLALIGLLLLSGNNVALVYAEKTVSSGLASLVLAVMPLCVALAEMILPVESLCLPRMAGHVPWFCRLSVLVWPSLRSGLSGDSARLVAIAVLLAGALFWTAGSLISRRSACPSTASWLLHGKC